MGFLRFFLAISVIFSHSGLLVIPFFNNSQLSSYSFGGRNAVGIFYIISGFYMSMILTDKYKNAIKTFYITRFLRIFPTYWFTLILAAIIIPFQYRTIIDCLIPTSTSTQLYYAFSNLFIFGSDAAYLISVKDFHMVWGPAFLDPAHNGYYYLVNAPVFTIAIELVFYLLCPLLIKNIRVTYIVFILSLAYHFWMIASHNVNEVFQYHFLPSSFLYFTLGILSHKLFYNTGFKLNNRRYMIYLAFGLMILFLQPLLPNIFILIFPVIIPYLFELTKSNKIDRFLGDLSYPIYIIHYILVVYFGKQPLSVETRTLYTVLGTIVLAVLVRLFIEVPIDKYRRGFQEK